ncbi:MAG: hypothetical protein M1839_001528 [Geoglossum umbratile]|nr:MAG: hypothetical protein M1839_001528 [Geoglossum umbratile]
MGFFVTTESDAIEVTWPANNETTTGTAGKQRNAKPGDNPFVCLSNGAELLTIQRLSLAGNDRILQPCMSTTPPTSPKPAKKRSHERINEPTPGPDVKAIEKLERPEALPQRSRSASPLKPGQTSPKKTVQLKPSLARHSKNAPQEQQGNVHAESPLTRSSEDSTQLDSRPKHPVEPFDWDKFEERFCNTMTELETREDKLYEEFTELTRVRYLTAYAIFFAYLESLSEGLLWPQFFEVWFSSLDLHEGDRAYKRYA